MARHKGKKENKAVNNRVVKKVNNKREFSVAEGWVMSGSQQSEKNRACERRRGQTIEHSCGDGEGPKGGGGAKRQNNHFNQKKKKKKRKKKKKKKKKK